MTPQSGHIQVNGATLYHETCGKPENPPLLLVSAGNGTSVFLEPLASALSRDFFVMTFDRRGFYRSMVESSESLSGDILTKNAEDCACIIEKLSSKRPAFVFASSGSATIALELLRIKPHLIVRAVLHEPILTAMLSPSDRLGLMELLDKATRVYKKSGSTAANRLLIPALSSPADISSLKSAPVLKQLAALPPNPVDVYFEYEMEAISHYPFDLQDLLPPKDQLCLARGDVASSTLAISPVARLSSVLNCSLEIFPGGHHGYVTHATSFCEKLVHVLKHTRECL
ncbi:alpha/beta-hydrolase [Penicillium antarcticum]|uniref:alpha/beta-hydrolase n=1 Tax=Penicillium antarcticum TaxID=416450 RepID=UPI002392ADBC|nr:alpha/beta-hydrolase [Penicillium antarcticum]KAJ5293837.1 alpha/beta-hydrolase [Penicillium antarcticum]